MSSSPDPFSLAFDSIEIDPARPHSAAFEHALALCAPTAAAPDLPSPGFYLLDDADGRFEIDRDMGVVTLKDETILDRERDAIHTARLRVVEPSGASYEIDLKLRLTGRTPQMAGAEENDFIAGLATAPMPAPAPQAPRTSWSKFAAVHAQPRTPISDAGPYGALLRADLPLTNAAAATLTLMDTPPLPAHAAADWSI